METKNQRVEVYSAVKRPEVHKDGRFNLVLVTQGKEIVRKSCTRAVWSGTMKKLLSWYDIEKFRVTTNADDVVTDIRPAEEKSDAAETADADYAIKILIDMNDFASVEENPGAEDAEAETVADWFNHADNKTRRVKVGEVINGFSVDRFVMEPPYTAYYLRS